MLHGFSSTPRQFKELSNYMSEKGFNVSAPLVAGHGTSPEDFIKSSPKDWTRSVMEAYLELKKISKKIFIIGNSFGSNLGLWLIKELDNEPSGIITLGAPLYLRYQWLIKLRYYTYGRFLKYYKKPKSIYKADCTDMNGEITYPVIPIKNLKEFLDFLEQETIPNLNKIRIPILIASASVDPIIHPKSVKCIYKNVCSPKKDIFWFESNKHSAVSEENLEILFKKAYDFIKEFS